MLRDSGGVRRRPKDVKGDTLFWGPLCASMSRRRLLWGAVPGSEGRYAGGPFSPRIFNTMVDAIMREWLRRTLGNGAVVVGVGEEIRQFLAAFYADDGLVQSSDPVRL